MALNEMKNCQKSMMPLREPRRKRRVRLRPRKPFPINIGSDNEWIVYTGHLANLGVCVTELYDIEALHSMGFFGKGSLSRSYPNFERTRRPVVRHRQWARRQEWLEQAKHLAAEALAKSMEEEKWKNTADIDSSKEMDGKKKTSVSEVQEASADGRASENEKNIVKDDSVHDSGEKTEPAEKKLRLATQEVARSSEKSGDCSNEEMDDKCEQNQVDKTVSVTQIQNNDSSPILFKNIETQDSHKTADKLTSVPAKVDEVVLDTSEEEDEVCEISHVETTESMTQNVCGDADIMVLNDEKMSTSLDEKNCCEIENETNVEDDHEMLERELLVLPDSDSDTENYLNNVKPTVEKEGFPVREVMYLTFEETFFLMFGLGCLQVIDFDGNSLSILDAWNHFCHVQSDFVQKYVVYHYFRSKGWVVKSGLKYGGDFLLYKQGPPFYHASYIVIVEVLDADTLTTDDKKTTRKMTWKKLYGLDRLSETAAKEILFAKVLWPSKIPRSEIPSTPELLCEFMVQELLYRRWIPKQNREEIDLEDENDDLE
ncbi:tRNA-splicing endonuclease subunit Sen2 isoform X1 [Neodiprion fabricii]|uniref:tRNA-splicing endonuclease subunit Sen2 isoform X1 n=1 Tax=Neodiprion fabricii TaxID=2872261 RepID=UPI001ED8EC02|nr:tRNA-splicing endonuclease subunit Sen2 isoform X1 [Neodiprion fabricii]